MRHGRADGLPRAPGPRQGQERSARGRAPRHTKRAPRREAPPGVARDHTKKITRPPRDGRGAPPRGPRRLGHGLGLDDARARRGAVRDRGRVRLRRLPRPRRRLRLHPFL